MGWAQPLDFEIVRQVLALRADAREFGDSFQNVVFMGMGEPLNNFEAVTAAAEILTDQQGWTVSPQGTISTAGLVPAIYKLAERKVPVSLAVSLNAATDEVRSSAECRLTAGTQSASF